MNEIFVGRQAEIARLEQFLGQTLAGAGQVAFVTGEAGTGKTALVREFARRSQAQHDDVLVALGEADARTGIGDAYLPFREVLRLLTGDVESQLAEGAISSENAGRLRDFVGVSAQVMLDLGPDLLEFFVPGVALAARVGSFFAGQTGLVSRLEKHAETAQARSPNGSDGVEQEHIFEQYTNVLRTLAGHQPIVLIIDDLQWADAASISLLFRLGRRIGESRILIIGTYRPDDVALGHSPASHDGVSERHPLLPVVNEFKRYSGDIEVQLSHEPRESENGSERAGDEAVTFVSSYIDAAYSPHDIGEDVIGLIAERTGGHPLFTIELLHSLEERGWLTRTPANGASDGKVWICECALELDALPPRVEAVVSERLGRLTDEQRRILSVASVEGNEFTAQVVAQIEGLKDLTLVRTLEEELQQRHRLIEEVGVERFNGQMLFLYQFRHSIFQRYLYEQLGMAQRVMLHDAVGEALEDLYGDDVHDLEVALAHHFLEAGNDEKALKYLIMAGDHAQSHHASQEALAHYNKAMQVIERLGDDADPQTIKTLLMQRAQVQGWLGHIDEAVADYEEALGIAETHDDHTCQTKCLISTGALLAGPRGFKEGMSYAGRALKIALEAGDKAAIVDSLNCLGNFQANLGQLADAAASHEQALALSRELGDERRIADSLDGLRLARFDSTAEEKVLLREVIDIRRRLGDQKGLLDPLTQMANAMGMFEGQYAAAERLLDEALDISRRIGERTTRPWILGTLAGVLWRSGRLEEAHERANEALDLAREIGHEEWMAYSQMMLSQVNLALYQYPRAQQQAKAGYELAEEIGAFLLQVNGEFMRGLIALHAGDVAEAVTWLEPAVKQVTGGNANAWVWLITPWLAIAYAAQGDIDQARRLLDEHLSDPAIQDMAELHLMSQYAHGRVAAAAGDVAAAEARLKKASKLAQQIGNPFFQIEVQRSLGQLYRDQNQIVEAEAHFSQVLEFGEQLAGTINDAEMREAYLGAPAFAEARTIASSIGS